MIHFSVQIIGFSCWPWDPYSSIELWTWLSISAFRSRWTVGLEAGRVWVKWLPNKLWNSGSFLWVQHILRQGDEVMSVESTDQLLKGFSILNCELWLSYISNWYVKNQCKFLLKYTEPVNRMNSIFFGTRSILMHLSCIFSNSWKVL